MHSVVHMLLLILEGLFIAGWVGSLIVVLISGVEDMKTVFTRDEVVEKHQPIEG